MKKEGLEGNCFHKEIKIIRSNLGEFRTNLKKLGLPWLIRLFIALILLSLLYYLYFI